MKTASPFALVTCLVFAWFAGPVLAADKEVQLDGTIVCAKCGLKETKKCVTAIQVQEGEKTVTYYFADKGNDESYHEEVCGGAKKEGTVKGTVMERDGKKWIKPTEVSYKT